MNNHGKKVHLEWIDVAKGICMALVVLGHTSEWYVRNFVSDESGFWVYLSLGLKPLRMPLFFMISGILAAGKVDRPLRQLWDKTGGLYLLYCLWTCIYCLKLAVPGGRNGLPFPDSVQIIGVLALPAILWYIWALPAFYLIAWALEQLFGRKSVYALLPMLGLLICSPWIGRATEDMLGTPLFLIHSQSVAGNLIWFYVGIKGRQHIISIAASVTPKRLALAVALAVSSAVAAWHLKNETIAFIATPLLLWVAIEILGSIRKESKLTQPFAIVGRETLPIYVLHTFILTGMTMVICILHLENILPFARLPLEIGGPIFVTVALMYGCMLASRLLVKLKLGFMVRPIPSPFPKAKGYRTPAQEI